MRTNWQEQRKRERGNTRRGHSGLVKRWPSVYWVTLRSIPSVGSRRSFSFSSVRLSKAMILKSQFRKKLRILDGLGPSKRFILSEIKQAARYNTRQSDVASLHRSITAAPEERSTTSLVLHYHDQIYSYCFLSYLLLLPSYPELLLSVIRTDSIHSWIRVQDRKTIWSNMI